MTRRSPELLYAGLAIFVITAAYVLGTNLLRSVPAASGLYGHSLGILGFLLMLSTETLYSLRKRSRRARWGRTSTWLRIHIFTGIVGPYLVLLHTAWKFNGLAGALTLLTGLVVLSGFVGRYIYTAVPRTVEGAEIEAAELEAEISAAEDELRRRLAGQPGLADRVAGRLGDLRRTPENPLRFVLTRPFVEWGQRLQWWRERREWQAAAGDQARELEALLQRSRTLRSQAASLTVARRLLSTWHAVHIPVGVVLFTVAFVHIGAAVYYATLLR
jgi:hypothetical protein